MANLINATDSLNTGRVKINAIIEDASAAVIAAESASATAGEAKTTANSVQTQLDTIILVDGASDAEVVQSRVDKDGKLYATLKDRLDSSDAQLDQTMTKMSSFPVLIPEANDLPRLLRAMQKAIQTKTVLDLAEETLVVDAKINVPSKLKLFMNKATIKSTLAGSTVLEIGGDVVIINGTIDGGGIAKHGINILPNSKNVFIDAIEIRNTHGDNVTGSYGIRIHNGCDNVHITRSSIKNITQVEDGIEGNEVGASRGILIGAVTRCSVKECRFENIGGFEDGDAVHVQTSQVTPLGWEKSYVVIANNEFYDVKKRAVKIQASNVIVIDNKIESNYIEVEKHPISAISSFGSYNHIIRNDIKLKRSNFGVEIANGIGTKLDGNNIEVDKIKMYPGGLLGALQSAVFITTGAERVKIMNNDLIAHQMGIYSTVPVNDITISGNSFLDGTIHPIDMSTISLLTIRDNIFLGKPYEAIKLRDPSNTIISDNQLGESDMGIRLFGVIDGVMIDGNDLDKVSITRVRTTDVTSGIHTLNVGANQYAKEQTATSAPTTGTWGIGDTVTNPTPSRQRNITHWKCYSAGTPGAWFAYGNGWGNTSERPTLTTRDAGYSFFDLDLGKTFMWNGFSWIG